MRERRNHLTLVGLIVAALIGVALLAVPSSPFHKGTTLGLDLQGGLEVVLKAVPPKGHKITEDDLDRSVDDHAEPHRQARRRRARAPQAGLRPDRHPARRRHDPEQAAELIGKTAQLELYDLEADLTGPSIGAQGVRSRRVAVRPPGAARVAQAPTDADGVLPIREERPRARRAGRHAGTALHEEAPAGTEGRQGPRASRRVRSSSPVPRQRSRRVLPTRRRAGRTTTSSATSRTTPRTRSRR